MTFPKTKHHTHYQYANVHRNLSNEQGTLRYRSSNLAFMTGLDANEADGIFKPLSVGGNMYILSFAECMNM